ncbi:MAG TPA: DUF2254 family protein, partial [Flavobacterium sp.]|nr:DUF2254 family protein [Flavobacterium sp.]
MFEHRIKHISTFLSGTFGLTLGCMLLLCDYFANIGLYIDAIAIYSRLLSVSIILISIIIGISLTTFSVIFVVMQLASSQFSPRILRHFLANDIKIQKFIGLFIGTLTLCILPQIASAVLNGFPFLITLSAGIFFAMKSLVWSYPRMITYLSENMNVAAITDKIKQEVLHEINEIYLDDWAPGNNLLYKRLRSHPENKKIFIASPFESGYLESIDYARLEKLIDLFISSNPETGTMVIFQKPVVGEFI